MKIDIPDGWKLVPIQPTDRMLSQAYGLSDLSDISAHPPSREATISELRVAYQVMLENAPEFPRLSFDDMEV